MESIGNTFVLLAQVSDYFTLEVESITQFTSPRDLELVGSVRHYLTGTLTLNSLVPAFNKVFLKEDFAVTITHADLYSFLIKLADSHSMTTDVDRLLFSVFLRRLAYYFNGDFSLEYVVGGFNVHDKVRNTERT